MNDDFDPRAAETKDNNLNSEFGDFETAFSNNGMSTNTANNPKPTQDDFADFSSAFGSANVNINAGFPSTNINALVSPPPTNPIKSTIPGSMSMPLIESNNLFGSSDVLDANVFQPPQPKVPTQVSNPSSASVDLLGGLEFNSLSLGPQTMNAQNGNQSSFAPPTLLDSLSGGE